MGERFLINSEKLIEIYNENPYLIATIMLGILTVISVFYIFSLEDKLVMYHSGTKIYCSNQCLGNTSYRFINDRINQRILIECACQNKSLVLQYFQSQP